MKRVISATIYVLLLLELSKFGGLWWFFGVCAFVLLCAKEYADLGGHRDMAKPHFLYYVMALLMPVIAYWKPELLSGCVCLSIFALGIGAFIGNHRFEDFIFQVFGVLYTGFSLSHLLLLRQIDLYLLWFFFLIPWITDMFAFFIGSLIGRHKLIPRISPNKSWEGAIGGIIFCILSLFIYNTFQLHLPIGAIILIGVCGSIAGQFGDILESWLKRWAGVKDSGKIMPGHGGALDRLDSMIVVAPLGYYIYLLADAIFRTIH